LQRRKKGIDKRRVVPSHEEFNQPESNEVARNYAGLSGSGFGAGSNAPGWKTFNVCIARSINAPSKTPRKELIQDR
jgi:hypothetical protein